MLIEPASSSVVSMVFSPPTDAFAQDQPVEREERPPQHRDPGEDLPDAPAEELAVLLHGLQQ